jgi:hypothetical protein
MSIPIGTLCWIVAAERGNEYMLGRVVTVVGHLEAMSARAGTRMHRVDALWGRIERPRCRLYAPPSSLRPIAGPEDEPVAPREHAPMAA